MSRPTWQTAEARILHLNAKSVPVAVISDLTGLSMPAIERVIREAA